jgi:tRNA A-37 threonylcarbamoyl transferase component Bud32
VPFSADKKFVRLTFMELFDSNYETIMNILNNNKKLPVSVYESVNNLAKMLWTHGISHNDLATQNILINRNDLNDIKILDFGLSQLINPILNNNNSKMKNAYTQYFKSNNKNTSDEQNGSNVTKLSELLQKISISQKST